MKKSFKLQCLVEIEDSDNQDINFGIDVYNNNGEKLIHSEDWQLIEETNQLDLKKEMVKFNGVSAKAPARKGKIVEKSNYDSIIGFLESLGFEKIK